MIVVLKSEFNSSEAEDDEEFDDDENRNQFVIKKDIQSLNKQWLNYG